MCPNFFQSRRKGDGPVKSTTLCTSGLRDTLRRMHLVDRSLLLFMAVLLAQSIYSMFSPGGAGQAAGDIDIIVRTSSAAIFGYFLSANFIHHTASAGQAPAEDRTVALETGGGSSSPSGPVARIGFSAGPEPVQAGGAQVQNTVSVQDRKAEAGCLQIKVATAIGLSCLVALLLLRNLSQWGVLPARWEAADATVAQLRDFVSGCVGFLIGCPTQSNSQAEPTA